MAAELAGRGLPGQRRPTAGPGLTGPDDGRPGAAQALKPSEPGAAGLDEVDQLLALAGPVLPPGGSRSTPRMVARPELLHRPDLGGDHAAWGRDRVGGGRYDQLIEQLGGPDVPAAGGSLGIERILLMLPDEGSGVRGRLDLAVTVLDQALAPRSFGFAAAGRGRPACGRASTWASPASWAGSSSGPAITARGGA